MPQIQPVVAGPAHVHIMSQSLTGGATAAFILSPGYGSAEHAPRHIPPSADQDKCEQYRTLRMTLIMAMVGCDR